MLSFVLCKTNWEENKLFVEDSMKNLYCKQFVSRDELAAVTGLLAGGRHGKLKNKDGSCKLTHIVSQKEIFAQQRTPYVYPLFKAHKLPLKDILQSKPEEVHKIIPSRLVVGMTNCQNVKSATIFRKHPYSTFKDVWKF